MLTTHMITMETTESHKTKIMYTSVQEDHNPWRRTTITEQHIGNNQDILACTLYKFAATPSYERARKLNIYCTDKGTSGIELNLITL